MFSLKIAKNLHTLTCIGPVHQTISIAIAIVTVISHRQLAGNPQVVNVWEEEAEAALKWIASAILSVFCSNDSNE